MTWTAIEASAQLTEPVSATGATRRLWAVSNGIDWTHYVVTSAVSVPYQGPETYVFPSDDQGQITDWLELPGSFKGDFDHMRAIEGYVDSLNALIEAVKS